MESEINEVEGHFAPLKKVTPLSKYLALSLFIILPFLGGWVGYSYAPEKVVEVEKIVEVEKVDSETSRAPEVFKNELKTQLVSTGNGFKMSIPSEWTYGPSAVHGGAAETIDVFDENDKLAMRILAINIVRGLEGEGRSFSKDAPIKADIGDVNKFTISTIATGQGAVIYNYGFMEAGFEITVPFGPKPLARNSGEFESGSGMPLRYENETEAQGDSLISQIVRSIAK